MDTLKFTVKRSQWLRGEAGDSSRLLRHSDSKKCCLGFAALASGYSEYEINGVADPQDLVFSTERAEGIIGQLVNVEDGMFKEAFGTGLSVSMICANDDCSITDTEREAQLTKLFAEIGVEVTFED